MPDQRTPEQKLADKKAFASAVEEAKTYLRIAASERRTVTYAELSDALTALKIPHFSFRMMHLLDRVCTEEDAARGIMLATLVVSKQTGLPGQGYFRNAARLGRTGDDQRRVWEAERDRVFEAYAGYAPDAGRSGRE